MDTSGCIINEITQGMELAKQLKSILGSESSLETKQALIQGIISSYDRALLMVKWGHSGGQSPPLTPPLAPPMLSQPESSVSIEESRSGDFNQPFDDQHDQKTVSKKRKTITTWRNQIRISTDNGLEGNTDDGYSWRKYGQKDILGAKFPRSYYRCTYRYMHQCMARKQVQRTDDDPMVFEITYRGQHTCNNASTPPVAPPQSPEKHETQQNNHLLQPPPKSEEILSNLKENLRVITSDSDAMVKNSFSFPSASSGPTENYQQFDLLNEIDYNFLQGYAPSFISPATSGSNYFTAQACDFQHHDDSRLSATITNSPLAFAADPQDLSPNFSYDLGFFI